MPMPPCIASTVHEAVAAVEAAFPGTTGENGVDRQKLAAAVLGKPEALRRLEAIVHPLVRREEERFLVSCRQAGIPLAVLDIPLLFETGGERRCDAVLVVTADPAIQKARVMARPGMTEERFALIHVKQMPDAEKRRRAHFLVDTGRGFAAAEVQVASIVRALAGRPGRALSQEGTTC